MSNYSDSAFDDANQNNAWYKALQLVPEKGVVLDVGCSSGHFGEELIRRKDCIVDGIELDADDANLAKKVLRDVWVLNVESDSLKEVGKGKYDVIYFGDVIEHLVHPVETLMRMKPLLKSTGKIIFSIPNMAHLTVRLALLKGDFDYTETGLLDKTHLHFYSQKEVFRIFAAAGYGVDKLDFVEKDYPKELLKQLLDKVGLEPKEAFYKSMQATDASAFQFVGTASISSKAKEAPLAQFGPIDMFEGFFNDTVANHKSHVKSLQDQLDASLARIAELEAVISHKNKHPYRAALGHTKRSATRIIKKA